MGLDYYHYDTLLKTVGLNEYPICAAWSPDGAKVLTHRTDQAARWSRRRPSRS